MLSYHLVLVSIGLLVVGLYNNWARPAMLFLATIFVFLIFGVLTPEEVLKGLANKQVAIIFLLTILVSGFRKTFGDGFFNYLFKSRLRPKQFLLRLMILVSSVSVFINNTPIVAFMVPYVKEWVDSKQWPVSKFMIPLAFSTVLGGMVTVVGTSTNLLLNGLISETNLAILTYKDFLYLGCIVTVLGLIYLYTIGYWLLPNKKSPTIEVEEHLNEYIVETVVTSDSELVGESITHAHLRNLKDIYLFQISRNGHSISPVSPKEIIKEKDYLYFSGKTSAIAQLVKTVKGLALPDSNLLSKYQHEHCIEGIIPSNSSLIGKKVKESNFRAKYNASIIALHRHGKRVVGSIGESVFSAGDLLLLLGNDKVNGNQADLFLLNRPNISLIPKAQTGKTKAITFISLILLILGIIGFIDLFISASLGISLFLLIKVLNAQDVKSAFDFDLAVLLVTSLALGLALSKSGAAQLLVEAMLRFGGTQPVVAISLLFLITVLITAIISNTATIAIVFPLAASLAQNLNISTTPVFVAIAFAASCDFMTPIGYQCNLMVYGPGNYTFKDFFKVGFPLTVIYSTVCIAFISWYYNL